jgi:hypothetical protein
MSRTLPEQEIELLLNFPAITSNEIIFQRIFRFKKEACSEHALHNRLPSIQESF